MDDFGALDGVKMMLAARACTLPPSEIQFGSGVQGEQGSKYTVPFYNHKESKTEEYTTHVSIC